MTDNLPPTFNPPPVPPPAVPAPPVPSATPEPTEVTTGFIEEKPHRKKVIVATLALILVVASTAAAVYLAGQRQEVRKEAEDKIVNDGPGGCCDPNNPHDLAEGCRDWEECAVDNGACATGKSCRVKECLANASACSDNWQCCSGYCVNRACAGEVRTCNSCAEMGTGYIDDPTCYAGGQACKESPQNGFCCQKPDGTKVCCYKNCECFEGEQGNCEKRGDGKIWLKGGITVSRIYKMVGTGVSCPFSSGTQIPLKENYTVPAGGEEFSLGANECGQIEAVDYCGSCKPGCGEQPTLSCSSCELYDESWQRITNLSSLRVGQKIYFLTKGSAPNKTSKARFKVNSQNWQESDVKHGDGYSLEFTIRAAGTYNIESEVFYPEINMWK